MTADDRAPERGETRILSAAELAPIGTRVQSFRNYGIKPEAIQSAVDRRLLFFHAEALAERLAASEATIAEMKGWYPYSRETLEASVKRRLAALAAAPSDAAGQEGR